MARMKLLWLSCAAATVTTSAASSSSTPTPTPSSRKRRILKYHDGRKEQVIQPLMKYSEHEQKNKDNEYAVHTYHSSSIARPPHEKHAPRTQKAKKRSDINPLEPIHPSRYVNYQNHPYQKRELRSRHARPGNEARVPKLSVLDAFNSMLNGEEETDDRPSEPHAFQSLRIHYDTTELESWAQHNSTSSPHTAAHIAYLMNYVLPSTAQLWSEALKVVRTASPLIIEHDSCPFASPESSPSFTTGVTDADIIIYVTANGDVCSNGNVLANAHSCYWDQYQRPIAGNIDFCLDTIEEGHLLIMEQVMRNEALMYGSWTMQDVRDVATSTTTAATARLNKEEQKEENREEELEYTLLTKEEQMDLASKRAASNKLLAMAIGTAMHEFAHVLGVTSDDLLFYYDSKTGYPRTPHPTLQTIDCVIPGTTKEVWMPSDNTLRKSNTTNGVSYFEVVTPIVTQVVKNQFNCEEEVTGARLENQPTNGDCFGSHFEERFFLTENMSPVLGGVPEILSSLTLALLHDSGWYEPRYEMARVSPFGHGAGCSFWNAPCIDATTGDVPSYSKGYFCNVEYKLHSFQDAHGGGTRYGNGLGCDAMHTHMGHCDLVNYKSLTSGLSGSAGKFESPGEDFLYFPESKFLGALMETTDYCPTYSIDPISCREVATATASGLLPRLDIPLLLQQEVESTGPSSRCFNTNSVRPMCLNARCDEESHTIKVMIGEQTYTCEEDGQMMEVPGTEGRVKFECPRLADMCPDLICPANCAGHGICDYSMPNPECRCFDENDITPGCYKSFTTMGPQVGWDEFITANGSSSNKLTWSLFSNKLLHGVIILVSIYFIGLT
mmetsp:Transcript_13846/g.17598  ORF Transcript_13846/g.17598 Transcript_13846/m.17598 type:complete len:837 (+) Transcript_13846:124-2634(+)